jgi:hypothetical protein
MNRSTDHTSAPEKASGPWARPEEDGPRACPACGAASRRESAHFCATCGREFDGEGYLPLDSIRASYHLQNSLTGSAMKSRGVRRAAHTPARRRARQRAMPFTKNSNSASTTALAFVTYALVPYLGILFCPGALLLGGIGLVRARRMPHVGGHRASVMSISMGVVILCAQLLLWWILYKVPEWSKQGF